MEIIGKLEFENNQCFIKTQNHRVNLFAWLASRSLKDKLVRVVVTKGIKHGNDIYFVEGDKK